MQSFSLLELVSKSVCLLSFLSHLVSLVTTRTLSWWGSGGIFFLFTYDDLQLSTLTLRLIHPIRHCAFFRKRALGIGTSFRAQRATIIMATNISDLHYIDSRLHGSSDLSHVLQLLAQETPFDWICLGLMFYAVYWVTDGFGTSSKPSPLLYIPVKDRTEYDNIPKKSRNVRDALKVGSIHLFNIQRPLRHPFLRFIQRTDNAYIGS
jgi:hypothetical protein